MQHHYFVIDIVCTGIDPNKDRVVEIACRDMNSGETFSELINPQKMVSTQILDTIRSTVKKVTDARTFGAVMKSLLDWIDARSPSDSQQVVLIAHNGHMFVYPTLTKELRRAKIALSRPYILWDTAYPLKQKKLTTIEQFASPRKLTASEKIDQLFLMYESLTSTPLRSDEAISVLSQSNQLAIQRHIQQPFKTKHITVNSLA
jgi:DNA polymerase III epsilon subunit-like protein